MLGHVGYWDARCNVMRVTNRRQYRGRMGRQEIHDVDKPHFAACSKGRKEHYPGKETERPAFPRLTAATLDAKWRSTFLVHSTWREM